MSAAPRMAFNGVWPTFLIRRRLPGFEAPTAQLLELIAGLEAREKDYTARYQEQDFLARSHPGLRWLRSQIDETIRAYLAHAGLKQPPAWRVYGWYNTNRYGDHHGAHTHPHAYLSGTFYAKVPAAPEKAGDPGVHPACISFHDPRCGANMVCVPGDRDSRSAYVVRPAAGTLLMWPSPVQHSVHPNLSQEHRVSISFNVTMEPGAYGWKAKG